MFFDELDAIVGKRSGASSTGVGGRLLSTLLNEMDGVGILANIYQSEEESNCKTRSQQFMKRKSEPEKSEYEQILDGTERRKLIFSSTAKEVVAVAASNRPDAIDEALLRPGRIDHRIYVPPPDLEARLQIFKVHTRFTPLGDDVDLEELSLVTELFTGADIENLCREVN